jgi:hypothetical protein
MGKVVRMTLFKGWVDTHGNKSPPKSAKGFEWPGRGVTQEQREAFQKNFARKLHALGMDHREFARRFYGETKTGNGYTAPRNPGTIIKYARGDSWPVEETARQLAAIFKTPMDQLLHDDGSPFEPLAIRGSRGTSAKRKTNGHAGNGAAGAAARIASPSAPALATGEPVQLPPRPADAKPAQLHVDAYPDAPDYCRVAITGTVRYDTAMAMVNLMGRDQHGQGPRHK